MAHVRKIETTKRRNGRPIAHYEVRWTEVEVTADGRRKRNRQETYPDPRGGGRRPRHRDRGRDDPGRGEVRA